MDLKNPTRTESLLANIAGYTGVPVPDMKNATRSERLLKEILDNGGGGGGGDVTKEYVDTAIANAVADIDDDISALSDTVADKVDKVNGKGLSTNDYTDADKALVQNSPITTTSTASPISTANGKPRAITIYGKSEVVDGVIKNAGEGYAVVDLGTLAWNYIPTQTRFYATLPSAKMPNVQTEIANILNSKYTAISFNSITTGTQDKVIAGVDTGNPFISIRDNDYTDATAFKNSLNGVLLCYELADPTQGNTIAVKTDNGTGINGTMAVFETGTPLYGVNDTVRDVMTWDVTAGSVTKKCGSVDLGTLNWSYSPTYAVFTAALQGLKYVAGNSNNVLCPLYTISPSQSASYAPDMSIYTRASEGVVGIGIKNSNYISSTDFKTAMNGVKLIYELATPTTEPLISAENDSIAGLKTYAPQTTVTINDNPEFEVEAYANTANGQVVSNMQPTRSPLLTLTASGWTNNTQTVTFAHDIGKRNSIDVEPANIKAWTAAGILATAETASTITFECDTVPTADLSFRVASMEVR